MFPIGPLSGRSLFQIMFEHCQARAKQFHCAIPIYVMTSPQTHQETDSFLRRHNYFGYPNDEVRLFCQGEMPALDCHTGKVLMAERGTIATSPDGHGGALRALDRSGCLADMQRRGVAYVFYGQIDNPLLQICDPAFIGCHILHHSQMTSQVIRKTEPLQRVGNVVQIQGRAQIIEYSDLPDAAAEQRNSDGTLRLWAGSIAVHVFDREFLSQAVQHPEWLPFHRALKKVPAIDGQGNCHVPTQNNAIKLERFIFDLMPHAAQALACEIDPAHGFAALKNAPPAATETATWVQHAISNHFRDWLTRAGCTMAEGATFEINPLFAVDVAELQKRLRPGQHFEQSTYLI
jgi:UDP-N-acetylglucosamine/UDP-N-acetylgalactosamine diphosphorylase